MISDIEHLQNIEALTEACEDAVRRGNRTVSIELPALGWLAIFDEIQNRRRENFSKLTADRHVEELNEVITRLHDLIVHILANGPGQISEAMAFDASVVRARQSTNPLIRGLQNLGALRRRNDPSNQ